MTIAHLSDTHLGYRAYGRTTPQGFDQREVDVFNTFNQCLTAILERDPDVVIHAGDLFHIVRPSNGMIVRTYGAIAKFQEKRGNRPLVIVGGNHDSPRTSDSGNILDLFKTIDGVRITTDRYEAIDFPDLNLEILSVPSNQIRFRGGEIEYLPTFGRGYSILAMHGMAKEAMPDQEFEFEIADTHADRWTYVALGDYHVHQAYGRNSCYAGSTDFTSTNIWEELSHPKGWVWFDTEKAHLEFVPQRTRPVQDLDPIDARNLDGQGIGDALMASADWDASAERIVRQRVLNVHPETRARIPQETIRELSKRCLHYRLDVRLMSSLLIPGLEKTAGESLEQSWGGHVARAVLPFGMEREMVATLGSSLMKEVLEIEADPTAA